MRLRQVVVALAVVCLSAEVRAQCPEGLLPGALAARIDAKGIELTRGLLLDMVPTEIEVPATPQTLLDCPAGFDDMVVTPLGAVLDVYVRSAEIRLEQGAIELDMELDISTEMELDMVLCAMPDATCDASLESQGIIVHARLEPSVDTCRPDLPLTVLDVQIEEYATIVRLASCGLYDDLWNLVYDWFRGFILDLAVSEIEEIAMEVLPGFLETFVTDMVADGYEIHGIRFNVAPQRIDVKPGSIVVELAANAVPVGPPAACLPADASLPPELNLTSTADLGSSMLAVAGSRDFFQRALRSAWLAGLFCFDSRDHDLDLSSAVELVAPGAALHATVSVDTPPKLQLGSDASPDAIRIEAERVTAVLHLEVPGAPTSEVTVQTGIGIEAGAYMDAQYHALMLELMAVESSGVTIDAAAASFELTPEAIAGLVDNVILPSFATGTGGLPLTSGLFVFSPIAIQLAGLDVSPTHLRADLDLWPIDPDDDIPPLTIVTPPPDPSPSDVMIAVGSVDDRTPQYFMRHHVIVDGVLEDAPQAGSVVLISGLGGGLHDVTLAAVDLNDNIDQSPVELKLDVDDEPPVVTITEAPLGVSRESRVDVGFVALDDRAPSETMRARYTVGAVSQTGGDDERLLGGDLGTARELTLDNLPEDRILRVTVFVTDAAGNEGSSAATFAVNVDPTLGCHSIPIDSSLGGLVALGALASLLEIRRRWGRRSGRP